MLTAVSSGDPISYLTLQTGTDVISADGDRVGVVEHVLHDAATDVFDGIVIDTSLGQAECTSSTPPRLQSSAPTPWS
jgi:hypothetical protein